MKKAVLKIAAWFVAFLVVMMLQKPLFVAVYHGIMGNPGIGDFFDIVAHGFAMDASMAAYMTFVPALLVIAMLWTSRRWTIVAEKVYTALMAGVIAVVTVLDLGLYGYWGFRLDMTPLFYFMTSPSAAMASAPWWQALLGIVAMAVLGAAIYFGIRLTVGRIKVEPTRNIASTAVAVVLTALLFLPARGGVTVSTMNLSRAYFSQNQRYNHAAMNPQFSLLYSATHQGKWDEQYRFMTADEAVDALAEVGRLATVEADTVARQLSRVDRPDVVVVILESFSSHLMPSLGGENVAVNYDSIAREGLLFTDFYACSFRTDRALPSILSGFPGLPSTSLMKNVDKIENAPSFPRSMKREGWDLSYFYGGDINFTNMLAYLVSAGFENVVADRDFPASERRGKWGAHDHHVFDRALQAIKSGDGHAPRLDVIQTSSSHEPFEVPYSNPRFADNARLNAFAYTDSCLGAFVDSLKCLPSWDRTLLVIVPDHYGVYPENLENPLDRHRIPLVIAGGALGSEPARIPFTGSQNDIAATILGGLGIGHDDFPFSKNLLDGRSPRYAVFTEPSLAALVTPGTAAVFNCDADADVLVEGPDSVAVARGARAMLQRLYDNLANL